MSALVGETHYPPHPLEIPEGVETMYDAFKRSVRIFGQRNAIATREVLPNGERGEYTWESYEQVAKRVFNYGTGLIRSGLIRPGASEFAPLYVPPECLVGIFASNQPEWLYSDFACQHYGWVSVPLYDSLGTESIRHILEETQLSIMICDLPRLPKLWKVLTMSPPTRPLRVILISPPLPPPSGRPTPGTVPTLPLRPLTREQLVWYLSVLHNPGTSGLQDAATPPPRDELDLLDASLRAGWTVYRYDDIEALGKTGHVLPTPPRPHSAFSVIYTSGTSGAPKGAILTHHNFLAAASSWLSHKIGFTPDVRHISFMPMAHVFERCLVCTSLSLGACTGFWSGNVTGLLDDILNFRPTVFVGVPRIFDRIYDGIMATVNKQWFYQRWIFNYALKTKIRGLAQGKVDHPLWDLVVFNKIKQKFGGCLTMIISGSAPLRPEVHHFFQAALGIDLLQGYGLTETAAVAALTLAPNFNTGDVGHPLPGTEIKLVATPESDLPPDQGEVWIRAPNVFQGYFHNPEKTTEAFAEGKWFRTGDVGQWTPQGSLCIVSRLSDMVKLPNGEFVSPERLEQTYQQSSLISQIYVHTDSYQSYVVAVVVPEEKELLAHVAKEEALKTSSFEDICRLDSTRDLYRQEFVRIARASSLAGFNIPRALHVTPEPFGIENQMLTPTMKLRRREIAHTYGPVLADLFQAPAPALTR